MSGFPHPNCANGGSALYGLLRRFWGRSTIFEIRVVPQFEIEDKKSRRRSFWSRLWRVRMFGVNFVSNQNTIVTSIADKLFHKRPFWRIATSLQKRLFIVLKACCTKPMGWFGSLHVWLRNISKGAGINGFQFVALALCAPVFHLSHFFFKLAYRIQKLEMSLLGRKCARLGGHDYGLQFDDLSLGGVMNKSKNELSDEKLQEIMNKLKGKNVQFKNCDLCGNTSWSLLPKFVSPIVVDSKGDSLPAMAFNKAVLMILFSCSNCGNAKFLEATKLGLSFDDLDKNK